MLTMMNKGSSAGRKWRRRRRTTAAAACRSARSSPRNSPAELARLSSLGGSNGVLVPSLYDLAVEECGRDRRESGDSTLWARVVVSNETGFHQLAGPLAPTSEPTKRTHLHIVTVPVGPHVLALLIRRKEGDGAREAGEELILVDVAGCRVNGRGRGRREVDGGHGGEDEGQG